MKKDIPFSKKEIEDLKSSFKSLFPKAGIPSEPSYKSHEVEHKKLTVNFSGKRLATALTLFGCSIQMLFTGKTSIRIQTK